MRPDSTGTLSPLATDAIAIHQASRRHFAEYFWIGRGVVGTLCGVALLCAASTATSIWAIHEARTASDRVERVVIYLDPDSVPVGHALAGSKWSPEARVYQNFARLWLINLRSRPRDSGQLRFQYSEVERTTDDNLRDRLKPSRDAADRQVQTAAIDVDQVTVIPAQDIGQDRAILRARWREQVRQQGAKPAVYTALMTVVYDRDKIVEGNILGLFVLDFQSVPEPT